MPAQKRLRRHDQSVATPRRKQSGECRKQRAIGRPQQGSPLLPAEHDQLMSQDEQFDIFGELAVSAPDQQPQHRREGEIGERKEHGRCSHRPPPKGGKSETFGLATGSAAIWYSRARVNELTGATRKRRRQ
jgi:hypothetical protein